MAILLRSSGARPDVPARRPHDARLGPRPGAVRRAPAQARAAVDLDPRAQPGRADDRRRALARHGRLAHGRGDAGLRGALPLPAAAAPAAAGAPRLRDGAGDPSERRRLLLRPDARRDLEPCPPPALPRLAARRLVRAPRAQAPRAASDDPAPPCADPGPGPRAPRPLRDDVGRPRARDAARDPDVRVRPRPRPPRHEEQRPAPLPRGGRPAPPRAGGPRHGGRPRRRAPRDAPGEAVARPGRLEGQRGRLGDGQREPRTGGAPGPG